ncbi:sulfotransferase [Roseofilum sp. BLCC_M154]|uniref:Sulfotransferase n=1 Tax=Roseofilum acuticapitatum BLCC-M154 TaxID=3022444 RepID=A0ABT7ARQ4_9CYAN|nr:sulfotransferase [Roseofilum acuticapitatum]MDJ1169589.1 sulfotransferase [Roseofilum acuticapitatum BLCC-M154]
MNIYSTRSIFLGGCPRSGTTLLQSLLGTHPEIASFPESHLFRKLRIPYWSRLLGLASLKGQEQLNWFLEEIGQAEFKSRLPKRPLFIAQYVSVFKQALDQATQKQGKSIWLEKSPENIRYIQLFEHLLPDAKFIHLIRNGADVVASLYDVSRKHKRRDIWGDPWDVDKCVATWIDSVKFSSSHLHKSNHILIRYEKLVNDPQQTLIQLCQFLGLEFDPVMLTAYGETAKQVVRPDETWKMAVAAPIENANGKKFYEFFDDQQQEYILQCLATVNVDDLELKNKNAIGLGS